MVAMLLILPKSVLKNLFRAWLTVSQLGRLDTACCVKDCRGLWEETLRFSRLQCAGFSACQSESFLSWVVKRKLEVQIIVFGSSFVDYAALRYSFLKVTGSHLRSVSFLPMKDSHGQTHVSDRVNVALRDVAMLCQNLETCVVNTPNDSAIHTLLARNQNLRRVSLEGTVALLPAVAHLVPTIHDITIYSIHPKCDDEDQLLRFLDDCPANLTRLSLPSTYFSNKLFEQVASCQQLVELRIGDVGLGCLNTMNVTMPNLVVFRCGVVAIKGSIFARLGVCMPALLTLILAPGTDVDCFYMYSRPEPFGVSDEVLHSLLTHMPRLRQFATEQEHLLRTHPLPPLPLLPALPTLHALPLLPISATSESASTAGVPVTCHLEEMYVTFPANYYCSVGNLFARCPHLRCVGVNTIPLSHLNFNLAFLQQCSHARIKRLCVGCKLAEDQVAEIRGVEELLLSDCSAMNDRACIILAQNNPHLQVLCIQKACVHHVTHRALLTFLEHCPLLRSVEFNLSLDSARPNCYAFSKVLFQQMLHKLYPNVTHFECNII